MYAAITGRGNHVLVDGRRGVLREEMAAYLREDLGLAAVAAVGNDGVLILRAQDLRRWMAGRPLPDSSLCVSVWISHGIDSTCPSDCRTLAAASR